MSRLYLVLVTLMALIAAPATLAVEPAELLVEARNAYADGDYGEATDYLRELFADPRLSSRQSAQGWGVAALIYYAQGDSDDAHAAYSRALSADPDFRFLPLEHSRDVIEFFEGEGAIAASGNGRRVLTPTEVSPVDTAGPALQQARESRRPDSPPDSRSAYQEYIAAYNKLTSLMARNKGDSPEAERAYEAYKEAKRIYEESL